MDQARRIEDTISLYRDIEKIVIRTGTLGQRLKMASLVLTVLTTGTLWALLGNVVPEATLWLGAVASTVTTGITLYILSSGLNKVQDEALQSFKEVTQFLADVRAKPEMAVGEYYDRLKAFQYLIKKLKYGRFED